MLCGVWVNKKNIMVCIYFFYKRLFICGMLIGFINSFSDISVLKRVDFF